MSNPLALVTGATGVVGPALVSRLIRQGYRVRILNRRPLPKGAFPDGVESIVGSINDVEAVADAMEGVSVVFHLAAKLHINNPVVRLMGEYRRVNIEGTRIVAECARTNGVHRFLFFSTIAVYGHSRPGEVLDEGSPVTPTSIYGRTKLEAEKIVLSLQREDGEPLGVVLRLAGVYGPRIKGNYRHLVRGLRHRWFLPIGAGTNRRTLVHERDVAEAALLAARHPAAAGQVFNVTDGSIHTFREIIAAICANLGRKPPRFYIPLELALALARAMDAGLGVVGRGPQVVPVVMKIVEDIAVSGDRIRELLGFQARVGLLAGWQTTIPGIMANGTGNEMHRG
jgi:nucleoside-diphosphate-sugar epimerase